MYALAVEGTTITDSAAVLADCYLQNGMSRVEAAELLVLNESLKAASSGFACGLTGGALLPLTVTADVCSSLFIQMRLCAAVAIIGGHDTADPRIRLLCWGAIAGDAATDAVTGIITRLMTQSLSLHESEMVLLPVLHRELFIQGSGILFKNGLLIPLLGGALNGAAAWLATRLTGKLALRLFIHPSVPPLSA